MTTITFDIDSIIDTLISAGVSREIAERAHKAICDGSRDLKYLPFDTQQEFSKLIAAGFSDEQAKALVQLNLTTARSVLSKVRSEFKGKHDR